MKNEVVVNTGTGLVMTEWQQKMWEDLKTLIREDRFLTRNLSNPSQIAKGKDDTEALLWAMGKIEKGESVWSE